MSTRRLPSGVAPSVRSRSLAFIGPALLTLAAPAAMAQAEPFITPVIKTDSTVLDVVPAMLGGGDAGASGGGHPASASGRFAAVRQKTRDALADGGWQATPVAEVMPTTLPATWASNAARAAVNRPSLDSK